MKQFILLSTMLILPFLGIAQELTKNKQVELDGFVWYETEHNGKYGAMDIDGNEIIPARYSIVLYRNTSDVRYFAVKEGDYIGAYTRKGTMIVSPDAHYTSISMQGWKHNIVCCQVSTTNGNRGLLDARGHEVISPNRGYMWFQICESFDDKKLYIKVEKDEYQGICDINGKEILSPNKYIRASLTSSTTLDVKSKDDPEEREIPLGFTYSDTTDYDFCSYDDLYRSNNNNQSSFNSSSEEIHTSIDFVFTCYGKTEDAGKTYSTIFPSIGKNNFTEYLVKVELSKRFVFVKLMTIDRMSDNTTTLIETHLIDPSVSMFTSNERTLSILFYENGDVKHICFIPEEQTFIISDLIDSSFKAIKQRIMLPPNEVEAKVIEQFNLTNKYKAGETDYVGKLSKLRTLLFLEYDWINE